MKRKQLILFALIFCCLLLNRNSALAKDALKYGTIGKPDCSFKYSSSSAEHIEHYYRDLLSGNSEYIVFRTPFSGGFLMVSLVNTHQGYILSASSNNNGKTLDATIDQALGDTIFQGLKNIKHLPYIDRSRVKSGHNYVRPCAVVGIKLSGQPLLQGGMNIVPDSPANYFVYNIPYKVEGLDLLFDKGEHQHYLLDKQDYAAAKIYSLLETLMIDYLPNYYLTLEVPALTDRVIPEKTDNPFPELRAK